VHGVPSSYGVICGSSILQTSYPQLFSYTKDKFITVRLVLELEAREDLFHLPLSIEAYEQFCELEIILQSLQQNNDKDRWSYIWGNESYSSSKAYKHLLGSNVVHLGFHCLWSTSCQQKHKVFF
jgi:hypothetical protein